ncbi:LOW QUALITY PROTEIN: hypothetical protein PanWU01x14_218680 [Parasponia andersonii]|uniref:Uncharacterized protein n=1 Tax=Parasponia andersonii TaxID=3476 RepID=A0A2P5BQS5_PARAD|nr:LOW QUALITY PROTEIN: hypothetical protein PanWU01x14_218680 [Parasponia andersonii]
MRRYALSSLVPLGFNGEAHCCQESKTFSPAHILPLDLPNGLLMLDFDIEVTCNWWLASVGEVSREVELATLEGGWRRWVVTSGGVLLKVREQPHRISGHGRRCQLVMVEERRRKRKRKRKRVEWVQKEENERVAF